VERSDDQRAEGTRRTRLASERTQLAWWRTGLTALAVALGVGRVLPELDRASAGWPYVVLGTVFALYGTAMIAYGSVRARDVDHAVDKGTFADRSSSVAAVLSATGALLGLSTALLILLD
jgi:putative membrane protein